jgi:threonylcarbamoyladenosine tRNA methylthiotransferase MtaB
MNRFLGQRLDALLEDRIDKNTGLYKGFSRNYIPVMIVNAGPALVNTVVSVRAEQMGEGGLIGRIVHE